MAESTQANNVMILSCSGCANVGQLANQAAVELTMEGFGKMFCLAGIGAHLPGFIQSAKDAPVLVAIDGCPVGCTRMTLEHAEVPVKNYLVVTEQGVEKGKDLNLKREDIDKVKTAVKSEVSGKMTTSFPSAGSPCGCTNC
jgi:uncharacterized metal-binding protein